MSEKPKDDLARLRAELNQPAPDLSTIATTAARLADQANAVEVRVECVRLSAEAYLRLGEVERARAQAKVAFDLALTLPPEGDPDAFSPVIEAGRTYVRALLQSDRSEIATLLSQLINLAQARGTAKQKVLTVEFHQAVRVLMAFGHQPDHPDD